MMKNRKPLWQAILVLYALAVVVALGSLLWHSPVLHKNGKTQRGSVAVVRIYGTIHTSMSSSGIGAQDADDTVQRLHELSEDDDVKAILLRINSPGGTVGAVQEIHREMERCRTKGKKIVAS